MLQVDANLWAVLHCHSPLTLFICSSNQQTTHQGAHICECYVLDLAGSSTRFGTVVEEFALLWLLTVIFHPALEVQQQFARCAQCQHAHTCGMGKRLPALCSWDTAIDLDLKSHTAAFGPWIEREGRIPATLPFLTPQGYVGKDMSGTDGDGWLSECKLASSVFVCRYRGVLTD